MLFLIIETFKGGDVAAVGERFKLKGRMLPEGLTYQASWIDPARLRCFQLMDAPSATLISEWTSHWRDLINFEVVPVQTSAEFWSKRTEHE